MTTAAQEMKRAFRVLAHEPRWLHRILAFVLGVFWIDCPRCGEPFGGHELSDHPAYGYGKAVCWRCEEWAVAYSLAHGVRYLT